MRASILLVFILVLAGCGSNDDPSSNSTVANVSDGGNAPPGGTQVPMEPTTDSGNQPTADPTGRPAADDAEQSSNLLPPAPPSDEDGVGNVPGNDTEVDACTGTTADTDAGTGTNTSTDTDTGTSAEDDSTTNANADSVSAGGTGSDGDTETASDTGTESGGPISSADNDLQRLFAGMTRQVGVTLVDLNERLRSGTLLSGLQNECLGAFDPALGEQLLAIDCLQPLATGDVAILVKRAAFAPSDACQADLAAGEFDSCELTLARITIPTRFVLPPAPADGSRPERPQPITGAELSFNVNDSPPLRITNTPSALTGVFSCSLLIDRQGNGGIVVENGPNSPVTGAVQSDCSSVIRQTADQFDALQPVGYSNN